MRIIVSPVQFIELIGGALSELLDENNWDMIGEMTPQEAVKEMLDMVDIFYGNPMIGVVAMFARTSLPEAWVSLEGQELVGSRYPELAAVVPPSWITFSGNIQLPDMTEKFPIAGQQSFPNGYTAGENTVALSVSEMPEHTHTYIPPTFNLDIEGPGVPDVGATVVGPPTATGTAGLGEPHNNMPAFVSFTFAIFTGRHYV